MLVFFSELKKLGLNYLPHELVDRYLEFELSDSPPVEIVLLCFPEPEETEL
jgi:hypothetical protein